MEWFYGVIIIKYISTLFEREKWRSIFLTLTPLRNNHNTSLRDLFSHQTHSSWMLNAHNVKPWILSSRTSKESAFATSKCSLNFQTQYSCKFLLAVPRGGKTKLAVGTAWRRKGNWVHHSPMNGLEPRNWKPLYWLQDPELSDAEVLFRLV